MAEDIVLKDLPAQPVLSIRAKVPMTGLEDFFAGSFAKLFPYLAKLGEQPVGPPMAVYHGQPGPEGIDAELCVPTEKVLAASDDIQAAELPAAKFATTMHTGPYEAVAATYKTLGEWIQANGLKIAGPSREIYFVGPGQADPEAYITEILFPVAPTS
jgi:effector-binding domain-containing protein